MDETTQNIETEAVEAPEPDKEYSGQKIMCYVSKKMVPIEDTVEIEYAPGKAVRVLPRYVKYA